MKKRQTNYRERGQLEGRMRLGELEKNRGYLERRGVEKRQEEKIQQIKKLADERNPDEFQFSMHTYRRSGMKLVKRLKEERAGADSGDGGKVENRTEGRRDENSAGGVSKRTVFAD